MTSIAERVARVLGSLPPGIDLVAAAKTRSCEEVSAALRAGVRMVGHNYVQEAAAMKAALPPQAASWTLIGHLQANKVRAAAALFDSIQTVDSVRLAAQLDRVCQSLGRILPVLVEVNSAREPGKSGVLPEEAADLVREIAHFESIRVEGLMTLGPAHADPEALRPFFRETKRLFDVISSQAGPRVRMRTLSMGMSGSYPVAIEEGATMIRLGSDLFGPRSQQSHRSG